MPITRPNVNLLQLQVFKYDVDAQHLSTRILDGGTQGMLPACTAHKQQYLPGIASLEQLAIDVAVSTPDELKVSEKYLLFASSGRLRQFL